MKSILALRSGWLVFGLATLASCASGNKPAANSNGNGTGGTNTQSTGGSTALDSGTTGGAVSLVAVPNDQDEFPVEKPKGLVPTPPMGWNSYNSYGSGATAQLIRDSADIIVSSGMKDAGYQYVNIDDGWMFQWPEWKDATSATSSTTPAPRPTGDGGGLALEPDPDSFPPDANGTNGIKVVADYVHSKGLKLGIYGSRGLMTCGGFPSSEGYELLDARAFAEWGVDYLKYDNCKATDVPMRDVYQAMHDALDTAMSESKHDIVFSLCSWEFDEWNPLIGQLWRTTGDIRAVFSDATQQVKSYTTYTALQLASLNKAYAAYAGPNSWNDADMLEVGNFGTSALADTESQTHFSLWAIMASPLIAGNKLTSMTDTTLKILTNRKIIAVNQDYLGLQGVPVKMTDSSMVWAKPLNKSGARAVLLINTGSSTQNVSVALPEVGLSDGTAKVFDLLLPDDPGTEITGKFAADIPKHGSVMLEMDGQEPGIPTGTANLSDLTWTYAANGAYANNGTGVRKNLSKSGNALTLNGNTYTSGLGVAAGSKITYRLAKRCSNFSAVIGVDDVTNGAGSVQFQVWADGERLYPTGDLTTMKGNDTAQNVSVDVSGKYRLTLLVTNAGDGDQPNGNAADFADWADAKLTCSP